MKPIHRIVLPLAALVAVVAIATGVAIQHDQAEANHHGICGRTQEVQSTILATLPNASDCADVADSDLASITGTLDLSGQSIDELRQVDFNGLANVRVIDLSDNNLDVIPIDIFNEMISLEEMLVSDNELTQLPTNPWAPSESLLRIDASNNAIEEIPANPFPYPNLRYVDLSNNSIRRLNGDEFAANTRIEEINLENNQLYGIAASWYGAENLQSIKLAGNPGAPFGIPVTITDLGGGVFQVNIESGAPFPVTVSLSSTGGALSENTVLIANGDIHGPVITATPSGTGPVNVSIDSATFTHGVQTGMALEAPPSVSIDPSSATQGICGRTRQIHAALSEHFGEHCSAIDQDRLSHIEGHFAVVGAGIESFKPGDLAGLTAIDDLYLYGNRVSELPAGFFSGVGNLKRVLLQDNPGADFPLNVSAVRQDDGSMKVLIRESTPFTVRVTLEANGGTVRPRVLYVYAGDTESESISVNSDQPGGNVNVRIAEAKFQDEWKLLKHSYHDGFHLKVEETEEAQAQQQTEAPAPQPTTTPAPEPTPEPSPVDPPAAPTNLRASPNDDGTITLNWNAPDDDSITGYLILRRRPTEGEPRLSVYVENTGSTEATYTDTGVVSGTRYVYRVKAINAAGAGERSNFVRVDR